MGGPNITYPSVTNPGLVIPPTPSAPSPTAGTLGKVKAPKGLVAEQAAAAALGTGQFRAEFGAFGIGIPKV